MLNAIINNYKKRIWLIIVMVFIPVILSGRIRAQSITDKKLDNTLKKCSLLVESKSYYNLWKYSKAALQNYPTEKYLHYYYALALYNDRKNKKILKLIPTEEALWKEICLHLEKSKPLKEFDKSFSSSLQKEFYKKTNEELGHGKFEHAQKIYKFWFEFFDNSEKWYTNKYTAKVQDTLFGYGKKYFFANDEAKADQAFNYMFKTFYNSKFEYVYDGSVGYNNSDYSFVQYHNPKYVLANTGKDESYLSDVEKQIIYLQNLARMDQKLFCSTYVEAYCLTYSYDKQDANMKSLIEQLEKDESSQILYPDENLCKASEYHANDMGKNGMTGHTSSDGTTFGGRLDKYGFNWSAAENCSYGPSEPFQIIMQLLIDQGVSSLGHRKNMLEKAYSKIGIAMRDHTSYRNNTVFDYVP